MTTAPKNQLRQAIELEKKRLDSKVSCQEDLQKKEILEQSRKLDRLVVLVMREQLQERKNSQIR